MESDALVHRGDIFWVDWTPGRGSEQEGRRPALVVQADAGNLQPRYPNTIVAAISNRLMRIPTHVGVEPSAENGLRYASCMKCEQVMTISKARLSGRIGRLSKSELERVDEALRRALSL